MYKIWKKKHIDRINFFFLSKMLSMCEKKSLNKIYQPRKASLTPILIIHQTLKIIQWTKCSLNGTKQDKKHDQYFDYRVQQFNSHNALFASVNDPVSMAFALIQEVSMLLVIQCLSAVETDLLTFAYFSQKLVQIMYMCITIQVKFYSSV